MADCNSIESLLNELLNKLNNNGGCCDELRQEDIKIKVTLALIQESLRKQRLVTEQLKREFIKLEKSNKNDKSIPGRLSRVETQMKAQIAFTAKLNTLAKKTDNDFRYAVKKWSQRFADIAKKFTELDKKNVDQDKKNSNQDTAISALKVAVAGLLLLGAKIAALIAKQTALDKAIDQLKRLPPPRQGQKGDKGDKGDRGQTGLKGDKGDQGQTGLKGDKGDKGDEGEVQIIEKEVIKLVYEQPDFTEVLAKILELKQKLIFNSTVEISSDCGVDPVAVNTTDLPSFLNAIEDKLSGLETLICQNPELEAYQLGNFTEPSTVTIQDGTRFIKVSVSGFPDGISKRFGRSAGQPNNYPFGFVAFESEYGLYPEANWEWINSYFYPDKEMKATKFHVYSNYPNINYSITGFKVKP